MQIAPTEESHMATSDLDLRATLAMRAEDTRIAYKHMVEAAERISTPANDRAYHGALAWWQTCRTREADARAAVINFNQEEVSA
jgi:hypothetical protein